MVTAILLFSIMLHADSFNSTLQVLKKSALHNYQDELKIRNNTYYLRRGLEVHLRGNMRCQVFISRAKFHREQTVTGCIYQVFNEL